MTGDLDTRVISFLFSAISMSSLKRTWGAMRIVALPLTRAQPPQRIITFYNFRLIAPPPLAAPPPPKDSQPPGWLAQRLPKEGVVNWASYKVDTMWSDWGKSETGSWRVRTGQF
jgi:hypothetical protein